jgi:hypothetical protein
MQLAEAIDMRPMNDRNLIRQPLGANARSISSANSRRASFLPTHLLFRAPIELRPACVHLPEPEVLNDDSEEQIEQLRWLFINGKKHFF